MTTFILIFFIIQVFKDGKTLEEEYKEKLESCQERYNENISNYTGVQCGNLH